VLRQTPDEGTFVMADIYIDMGALATTKGNLSDVEDLLRGPCHGMAALPCEAAGHGDLESALGDFGSDWDYGIGKLGEFSGAAVEALGTIADAFNELDEQLRASFDQEG
jgi:hypothetical protein